MNVNDFGTTTVQDNTEEILPKESHSHILMTGGGGVGRSE